MNNRLKLKIFPRYACFILLCCLILSGACSRRNASYFPLNAGYKWQYDIRQKTRDGLIRQKYILSNLGESILDKQTVFLRHTLDGTALYYSVSDREIVYLGYSKNNALVPEFKKDRQIVIRKPVVVNTQWEQSTMTRLLKKIMPSQKTESGIVARIPLQVKIESLNETVRVPAGRFEQCMKITMIGSAYKDTGDYTGLTVVSVKQTKWYAKGVGLIKMERLETAQSEALDGGSLSLELVNFDTGQASFL